MIPFVYRLRGKVRIERQENSALIISEIPLNLIRVSTRAARIFELPGHTVTRMGELIGMPEGEVYRICQYFVKKGILEMEPLREDASNPSVSVIIPVRDRKEDLRHCLTSLFALNYPHMEVIVVDDGSTDGSTDLARTFPVTVLSHPISRGQSYCRNLGANEAHGEILAFIDSDCVADPRWLKELTPYFQWEKIAAVGGYVDGYYEETALDRYEKTCSPLTMGKRFLFGGDDESTFYVPTCNLLVRARVYQEIGGITESLHVGEDVDLCWRMRKRGYHLLYVPKGTVFHKHRSRLLSMLTRRYDYGTSEALLYTLHREKKKVFSLPPFSLVSLLSLCLSLLFFTPLFLIPMGVSLLTETMLKIGKVEKRVTPFTMFLSVGRSHFSFFYFVSFHLVRYYLAPLLLLGCFFPPLLMVTLLMVLLSSSVDYMTKGPGVSYPAFFFFSTLEHLFYQVGVLGGCVRRGTFRSYAPRVFKRMPAKA